MIEQDETDKKIFDEYLKFSKDFDEKVELHLNLKLRMGKFIKPLYNDVPSYVGDKLMPIMFSNLVKVHTDMMSIDDKDNYLFVATAKGIRKRYRHSSHSDMLSLNELHSLCNGKFSEVETWFKSILKPKRLLVLNQFREAFNNGFNDEWIGKNDKKVSFEVPVDRDVWFIGNGNPELLSHYYVRSIVALMNVTDGELDIVFVTDKYKMGDVPDSCSKRNEDDFIFWNPDSFFPMFSFRHVLPELGLLMDKLNDYYSAEEKKVEAWFESFKQKLSIYISLINL